MDIGLERDCLLHVREMSRTFTPRARDAVSTKDVVRVRVTFVNADECKVGLSLIEVRDKTVIAKNSPPCCFVCCCFSLVSMCCFDPLFLIVVLVFSCFYFFEGV